MFLSPLRNILLPLPIQYTQTGLCNSPSNALPLHFRSKLHHHPSFQTRNVRGSFDSSLSSHTTWRVVSCWNGRGVVGRGPGVGFSWETSSAIAYCLLVADGGTARGWNTALQEGGLACLGFQLSEIPESRGENDQRQSCTTEPTAWTRTKNGPRSPGGREQEWAGKTQGQTR